jgi:hypothetical protein
VFSVASDGASEFAGIEIEEEMLAAPIRSGGGASWATSGQFDPVAADLFESCDVNSGFGSGHG